MRIALVRTVAQIERWTTFLVLAVLASAGYVAAKYAFHWRLSLDEIMTTLIVKQPTAKQVWAVCFSGADNQPPAYDFLLRASVSILRNDALGIRLPSLCGYLLGAFCLYVFVRLFTGVRLYGLIAVLFSLTSGGWYYATEGRPYGLMFGCAGLAAVFWQQSLHRKVRWSWLIAFSLTLAAALNLHYYSILLFFPFAIAETVRIYVLRRLDVAFWISWAVPVLALLPYVSLIRIARTRAGIPDAYFAKPDLFGSLAETCNLYVAPCLVPLLATVVICFVLRGIRWRSIPSSAEPISRDENRLAERWLIAGFVCLPLAGIALSLYGTHIFFARYLIASIFGFSALVPLLLSSACKRSVVIAAAAALIFGIFVFHNLQGQLEEARWWGYRGAATQVVHQLPEQVLQSSTPIVMSYLGDFMQFEYYSDSALRQRIFYLSSEDSAKKYLRFTFQERMMIGSAPFFGTKVVPYADFIKTHRSFYVFGGLGTPDWLFPQLLADGAQFQLLQGGIMSPDGLFHLPVMYANLPR